MPIANDREARLDQYLNQVQHLPPAPTLLVELLDQFKSPDRDLDRVVELIRHDPSLTAEILRTCNGAFFGGEEPAQDIFDAVLRLGFYEVYTTVVSLFGSKVMKTPGLGKNLDVKALWHHSMVVAGTSSTLARQAGEDEGAAFTAGLLHDVGKMVLASVAGASYDSLHRKALEQQLELPEIERQVFEVDHAEIGARLLMRWHLPIRVTEAVICHHQYSQASGASRLAATVHLGNLLARIIERPSAEVLAGFPLNESSAVALSLEKEALPYLIRTMQSAVERATDLDLG